MLSLLRCQKSVRGSVAWARARTIPFAHTPIRLQSSAASPISSEVLLMLQEERKLSRELQAHLRAKDEDLRRLLESKDEDLRSKDEDLRSKDEDLRSLLKRKEEDLRSKDEDLRSLLERKDEDLRSKDKELSELHPLVAQFKFQQHELLRYKNIVSCRGALELVAAQKGLPNASNVKGWRHEFGGSLAPVLNSCNSTEKILNDNRGRPHDPSSLTKKLMAIWQRLCSDLHPGGQFQSEESKVVLRANGLSDSDVLVLQILFSNCGIDAEIRPRVDSFDGAFSGDTPVLD